MSDDLVCVQCEGRSFETGVSRGLFRWICLKCGHESFGTSSSDGPEITPYYNKSASCVICISRKDGSLSLKDLVIIKKNVIEVRRFSNAELILMKKSDGLIKVGGFKCHRAHLIKNRLEHLCQDLMVEVI